MEIPIDEIYGVGTTIPTVVQDSTSLAYYHAWPLSGKAVFSFDVPENYQAGTDIVLRVQEASPNASDNHKWQFKVLLIQPAVNVVNAATLQDTVNQEYASDATAYELTTRSITICSGGEVASTAIAEGDNIQVQMQRVAASADEDAASIRVFKMVCDATTGAGATISNCTGRVGAIIDVVKRRFNDENPNTGFLSDTFILGEINQCLYDLTREDLFSKVTWINAVSGQNIYALMDVISDYETVHEVYYSGGTEPLLNISTYPDYLNFQMQLDNSGGAPSGWFVDGTNLVIWPYCSGNITSGLAVYHSYLPSDLGCTSGTTPPVPKAHDSIFIEWCLAQAWLRDSRAETTGEKTQYWYELHLNRYMRAKGDLLGALESKTIEIRPRG
jgi:hypothetical protein